IKRDTDTTSTNMQGATNIDSQNFVDNADDDHPLTTQFYVPEDAVAVNKLELNLSRDEFRGYVRNEPHSHTVDVTHPSHSHDVTHPSHSHDVSDSTTSTASDVSTNWATSNDYGFISSGGSLTTTISRSNLDVTFSQDYALITVTIYTTNSTSSTNGWDLTVTNDDEGTTLYSDTDIIAGSEKGPVTVQFRETAILDNDQISATLDNNSDEAEDMTVSLNILQVGQHTHDVSISDTSTSALGTTETSTTALGNTVSESSSNSGEPAYGLFSPDTEPKVDVDVFVDGSKVTRITDLGVLGTSSKIDLKTYLSDPVAGSWHELELKPVGNTFKDSFEGLSDGSYPTNWTDTSDLKGEADTAYAQNGSVSFLHDSGGSNVSDGTQAYHNLSADTDVEEFSFWYRETSNSTGGGMSLKDANGKRLLFVGVDNPELQIFSGNGFEYGGNAGPMPWSKNYQVWRKFTVRLNNAKNTFTVDWYDSDSDETRTYGPFPLNSTNQVSRVTVDNQNGASLGGTSSSMVHWTDNVKLGLSRCRLNGSLFSKVFVESKL
ncbi:MAG: hypothetical protein SVV03_02695, partial [Candidatus Nanohaloarchaea archaeon]|nr:hypothetical protein [Candidatus Nanohaloarchaea archaeon]